MGTWALSELIELAVVRAFHVAIANSGALGRENCFSMFVATTVAAVLGFRALGLFVFQGV